MSKILVVGAAGFIGSHLVEALLAKGDSVVAFDDLSNGKREWLPRRGTKRFTFVCDSARYESGLVRAMTDCDEVFHLAANADISKAEKEPDIDFLNGTLLTHNVIMAAIKTKVKKITFSSSGGVYGDYSLLPYCENHLPRPIAMYSAAKIASEMELCAWSHMFKSQVVCFRFANVVGPRQTHGVALEFVKRFKEEPDRKELLINGNGQMSRHYIHVKDIVRALITPKKKDPYQVWNLKTTGLITVNRVAELVCQELKKTKVEFRYKGGEVGWNGDCRVTNMTCSFDKFHDWVPKYTGEEALLDAIKWLNENLEPITPVELQFCFECGAPSGGHPRCNACQRLYTGNENP